MIVIAVMLFFTILILAEWVYLSYFHEKKSLKVKTEPSNIPIHNRYYHPGHTWVELNPKDQSVSIGLDQFTHKIIGHIDHSEFPKIGQMIQQGSKLWTLIRENRTLNQVSPISGKVLQVNTLNAPDQSHIDSRWLLKIRPIELNQNLNNLLSGDIAKKWKQWSKEQFLKQFSTALGPLYQDGGELKDDLFHLISDEQWEKIQIEYFKSSFERNHNHKMKGELW